jgi:hypothetical protein
MVPKFGRNTLAGIVHDYLYKAGEIDTLVDTSEYPGGEATKKVITRKKADQIRLDFCVKCSVPKYQRILSYWALRIFGRGAWKAHRKRGKA